MSGIQNTFNRIKRQRNVKLDFLRVLAIIVCIVMHALMGEDVPETEYHWRIFFLPDVGGIFIMASGAIILNRTDCEPCGWKYVWHRVASFLPEFVIFSVLYVFLDKAYGFEVSETYSVSRRIMYMFFTPTWGPGWFILALTGCYLVLPLLSAWVRSASRRQIEIGLGIWICSTCLPFVMTQTTVNVPESLFGTVFNYSGYMLMGYYLLRWPFRLRSFRFKAVYFVCCVGVGFGLGYLLAQSGAKWGYMGNLETGLSVNVMAVTLLLYGVILQLPDKLFSGVAGRIFTSLSTVSLGIYCCHWLIIRYWAIEEGVNWLTATVVTLVITIPLAYIMKYIRNLKFKS